jgi:phosphopantothenoylcysteine decarboxylase/phosphopantothenate--cysteine ligase
MSGESARSETRDDIEARQMMEDKATAMDPRRIVIAVTGGIAAYKIPELVRVLSAAGHATRCVLTSEATQFVSPLVLQTLSQHPVASSLFSDDSAGQDGEIDHIALADWADLVIVAPATANILAKLNLGITDDLVTAVLLATQAPVLLAPAMNVNMWSHPATAANVSALRSRGVHFVGPESGELACGWQGEGRMSPPEEIARMASQVMTAPSLIGQVVLVTAGGTEEPIDAVRSITNRSSGKMGFAIAAEASRRGAEVILVSGVTGLETPGGVDRIEVRSSLEMRDAVMAQLPRANVVIKAAAVADFRPANASELKIKKEDLNSDSPLRIELVENPDILAEVSRSERHRRGECVVVGFAAESHDVIPASQRKLERKGCDFIVANDISRSDSGFNVDHNAVSFVWPEGEVEELALLPKDRVAAEVLDRVEKLLGGRS